MLEIAFELIDRIIRNDIAFGFPSAQLAVMQNGAFLYENAWGKGISNATLFDLASNTKVYSVVYAMQYLASRGLVDVNARIVDLIGERFADDVLDLRYVGGNGITLETQRAWKRRITVRQVLSHQAGLPQEARFLFDSGFHFENADGNPLYVGNDASEATRAKVLDALCKMPVCREPGLQIVYSDVDFILLGLIVKKITGMELQAFLSETFWKPLGLECITYNPLRHGFTADDCAPTELHGNTRDGAVFFEGVRTKTVRGEVHDATAWHALGGMSGHAGLFANVHDLAQLANVMLEPEGFFSPDILRTFTAPVSAEHDEWGLGWYRQGDLKRTNWFGTRASKATVGHSGWTGTMTMIDPETKIVCVLLTSKRNTPVTDPKKDRNTFDGNHYTTASAGFVPQILYDAINGTPLNETLQALVDNMREQATAQPCEAAERAYQSIRRTQSEFIARG